jgi:hypothetical protein
MINYRGGGDRDQAVSTFKASLICRPVYLVVGDTVTFDLLGILMMFPSQSGVSCTPIDGGRTL